MAQAGGRPGRARRAAVRDLDRQGRHRGAVVGRRACSRRSWCRRARRSRSGRSSRRSPKAGRVAAEAPGAAAQLASDGSAEAETSPATAGGADAPSAPAPPAAAPPTAPRRRRRRWRLRRRRLRRRLRIGGLGRRSCRRSFGSWRRSTASISRRCAGPGPGGGSRRTTCWGSWRLGGPGRRPSAGGDGTRSRRAARSGERARAGCRGAGRAGRPWGAARRSCRSRTSASRSRST